MSTGQWIGQTVDRLDDNRVVYQSRPTDWETAQHRAEARARRLGCGDRFGVQVVNRFAKEG